jgi:hypothetical protein
MHNHAYDAVIDYAGSIAGWGVGTDPKMTVWAAVIGLISNYGVEPDAYDVRDAHWQDGMNGNLPASWTDRGTCMAVIHPNMDHELSYIFWDGISTASNY